MGAAEKLSWSRQEFEQQLRAKGERYHIHHPFQVRMNAGHCTRAQVQGWVCNRFYYQISIPLKELFAPEIHRNRLASWPQHYPWIEPEGLQYFRSRVTQARRDVEHGLALTLDHFRTREEQERALEILQFKLDVLWSMLDAMQTAYGLPGGDDVR